MKIEVNTRWVDDGPLSEEETNKRKMRALNDPDYNEQRDEPVRFIHRLAVIDLRDIKAFNESDEGYTTVRFEDGDQFSLVIPYEAFKSIYKELTGDSIKTIVIKQSESSKAKQKPLKRDDADDINLSF